MTISLKPEHLKRYKDIAYLFMKYGRADLVRQTGLDAALETEEAAHPEGVAKVTSWRLIWND